MPPWTLNRNPTNLTANPTYNEPHRKPHGKATAHPTVNPTANRAVDHRVGLGFNRVGGWLGLHWGWIRSWICRGVRSGITSEPRL